MNQLGIEMEGVRHNQPTTFKKIRSFLWHLLQMVLAMEAGMAIYHIFKGTVLAGTTYAVLTKEYPLFGYWMMVIAMSLAMIALMRYYHKSIWLYCLKMTAAMVAPLIPLTILVQLGLFPIKLVQVGLGDALMVLAMAGYMLLRPAAHNHGVYGESKTSCH